MCVVFVRVCVRACVRACVCVCACVRACVWWGPPREREVPAGRVHHELGGPDRLAFWSHQRGGADCYTSTLALGGSEARS